MRHRYNQDPGARRLVKSKGEVKRMYSSTSIDSAGVELLWSVSLLVNCRKRFNYALTAAAFVTRPCPRASLREYSAPGFTTG